MEGKSILIFGENHDEYYTENDYEKLHEFIELNKGVENIISIREDLSLNDVIQNFDTPNISFMVNHYQEDGMDYINSREICPYKNIFEIDYRNLGRIHEIISDSLQRYKLGYSINDINEKLKDIWGRYYDLLGIVFYDDVNLKEQVILYFDYLQETYNIYSDGIERENEINWLDEKNETLMILLYYKNFLYQNYNSDVI